MKRVLLEMMGLHEDQIAKRANEIGKRYVQAWRQGKGKDDPAVPGIIKDLQPLLKDAMPKLKKDNSGWDLRDLASRRLQWLKRVKPERMTNVDFHELANIIDDLKMWLG